MVYIYEKNGEIKYVRDERPDVEKMIELKRMIPRPGAYKTVLRADFDKGTVWYEPVYEVYEPVPQSLESAVDAKVREIKSYDVSSNVNSFSLNGVSMWLSKDTRVGLVNSIGMEKAAGKENTLLWYNGVSYNIPIGSALQMLSALELYALGCYNTTQQHIAALKALETVDEVNAYDYTSGYPEKLVLTFNEE